MSSLPFPPALRLRASSPSAPAPANRRKHAARASVVAALGGDGGCGGSGMEQLRQGKASGSPVQEKPVMSNIGKSTNILWHDCPIGQPERQKLLGQKGCVIWITGLSGSGKSTVACALSRELHCRGHHTYVLDGDNLRHGLNRDLSFKAEDRTENIRRVGEVAKLFADAGTICIASLISPYRRDRDACRALLPDSRFIEVFMDLPLELCEARDPKGLYKLARTGKIKGFTGVDDPYESPVNSEIVIKMEDGECPSPKAMAMQVLFYLEKNGYLQA
ncbi:adenylyl-sulfate kinase 3-like [Lolium rigidum]|uniref:adenylyl-sulfate kinase 3-like n=1 Tax=Lolium rigidum TaxID=89674 RepID=UPI001F5E1638|nr:adenylyl-sulfate kinase 3-like [Lolium rigidum]XP_047085116.1 adenylyl-sulfate kinase 3-like [Lolium rigidum]XP_051182761.1 adenylyl-sulfate kinase 3-like [Lolium perenne]